MVFFSEQNNDDNNCGSGSIYWGSVASRIQQKLIHKKQLVIPASLPPPHLFLPTWRIIPFSKWFITMFICLVSPQFLGSSDPFQTGRTSWLRYGSDPNYLRPFLGWSSKCLSPPSILGCRNEYLQTCHPKKIDDSWDPLRGSPFSTKWAVWADRYEWSCCKPINGLFSPYLKRL